MPISEYTGREITEEQKKVEDAWNGKSGNRCNIQYLNFDKEWEYYERNCKPRFDWENITYKVIGAEPEKPNLLPWNTDIFDLPGFPPEIIEIYCEKPRGLIGISEDRVFYHFDFYHDCTDFENSTLHRPGTEKILPCPLCKSENIKETKYDEPGEKYYHCRDCHCEAPMEVWQKERCENEKT